MNDSRPPRSPQRSQTRPADRQKRTDPARQTAYRTLRAVDHGAYANLELVAQQDRARLSGRDAAFCTELCHGTIRMQGFYDHVLALAAQRPIATVDAPTLDVMRLGAHQILGMRVPDHAAVSATVALARQELSIGAGGFVNAVLRRVSERSCQDWDAAVTAQVEDPIEILSRRYSHPVWVVRALRAGLLGHQASTASTVDADLAALLHAHNVPGPLTLTARPGLGADDELIAAGADPDPAAASAWTLRHGRPGAISAVREGRAAVQDAGSQLVALALLAAEVTDDAGRWLDVCAGPGGKAGLLAAAALQRGARLRANEVSRHRADLVTATLRGVRAAGGDIDVTVGDGADIGDHLADHYDRTLVDAPCTGLGALRRRPEARWRRQPGDLTDLAPLQRSLLSSAVRATRPGGVILYATCSPHIAETTVVIHDVARTTGCVELLDVRPLLRHRDGSAYAQLGPGPGAQLFGHLHGTDAMFMSLMRRT